MPRKKRPQPSTALYDRHKTAALERSRRISTAGRDIGDIPRVGDVERRSRCERDFRQFCETYFSQTFSLPWSDDHRRVIARVEQAVLYGGLFAMAMPRGSGKTSIAECACLWSVLYGHHHFVVLIGASESHSSEMLDSLKSELESNELLVEDFPEVCYPIGCLDGIANRASGQLYRGKRTRISWTSGQIVLPTIEGSQASGAVVKVTGITGRIRGMKHKRPDGTTVRPSLVVIDDPQTDESAWSSSQCAQREKILAGAVLGLAGPGQKISGIMPCTVIRRGDMADNILDRSKHPEWNGERTKMIYAFPKREDLWGKYAEILRESLRSHGDIRDATRFYSEHREQMDEGAVVAWPHRFNHDELSAVQHAMNLRLQDRAAFFAEYQNEPCDEDDGLSDWVDFTPQRLKEKLNGRSRGQVPAEATRLTAFIDVHDRLLYWCACAWREDFTGYIVDYGVFPKQPGSYFHLRDANPSLEKMFPGKGREGSVHAGLMALCESLSTYGWKRPDGTMVRVDQILIDSGYMPSVCNSVAVRMGSSVMLSRGIGVKAGNRPMSEYSRKPDERHGVNWFIPNAKRAGEFRHVVFDANYWKTFVYEGLAASAGDRGSITIFGKSIDQHRLFLDHVLHAETSVLTEGHGRRVREWKIRPSKPDNHWFDCLVGCAVAASVIGTGMSETFHAAGVRRRRRYTQEDLRRRPV